MRAAGVLVILTAGLLIARPLSASVVPESVTAVLTALGIASETSDRALFDGVGPRPTSTPLCADTLYASSTGGVLYTLNVNTSAATLVGNLPDNGLTEIEYDPISGRAFAQNGNLEGIGWEFDLTTGNQVGNSITNNFSFTGLEWVGSTLYGTAITAANGPSSLRILNPWTGTSTLIGTTGQGPISGLAYQSSTGIMYGAVSGASAPRLVKLNLSTGAATVVGNLVISAGSLEFGPDGNLYAGGRAGELIRINPANGSATLVGKTGIGVISGLVNACPVGGTPTPTPTPNSNSYTDPNSNSNSYADADADANSYTDTDTNSDTVTFSGAGSDDQPIGQP